MPRFKVRYSVINPDTYELEFKSRAFKSDKARSDWAWNAVRTGTIQSVHSYDPPEACRISAFDNYEVVDEAAEIKSEKEEN